MSDDVSRKLELTSSLGIWSRGRGPPAAREVKFIAVTTKESAFFSLTLLEIQGKTRTGRNNGVVSSIDIDGLEKRESDVAANNRFVDSRFGLREESFISRSESSQVTKKTYRCDTGLCQTRNELFHPANTLGTDRRVSRTIGVPERQIYTTQIMELLNSIRGIVRRKHLPMLYAKPFHSSSVKRSQNEEYPRATVYWTEGLSALFVPLITGRV